MSKTESTTSELADFLVSHEKNDPGDPRFSQASEALRRLEGRVEQLQDELTMSGDWSMRPHECMYQEKFTGQQARIEELENEVAELEDVLACQEAGERRVKQ